MNASDVLKHQGVTQALDLVRAAVSDVVAVALAVNDADTAPADVADTLATQTITITELQAQNLNLREMLASSERQVERVLAQLAAAGVSASEAGARAAASSRSSSSTPVELAGGLPADTPERLVALDRRDE